MARKNKAQSIMESTIVFLAGSMLIGAAIGIFVWGIAHLPIRQITYEFTRTMAGTPGRYVNENGATPTPLKAVWPTYVVSPAGIDY